MKRTKADIDAEEIAKKEARIVKNSEKIPPLVFTGNKIVGSLSPVLNEAKNLGGVITRID